MKRCTALALTLIMFVSFGLMGCSSQQTGEKKSESVYKRVLRTKTLRCAYSIYPPYCMKDPNTEKLTGIFIEVMEAMGKKLELKVDWVEEVGFGVIFEGLEVDRYDIYSSGVWPNALRGKKGYFSKPIFYNAIRIWVRADENRFQKLEDLNSPEIRMSAHDGTIEQGIIKIDFPKAQQVFLPQLTPWTDNLMNITTGKADVTFGEATAVRPFLEKNPGTLKEFETERPIRIFANTYAMKMGENEFKSMIDSAIDELINDGTVEKILQKYEAVPGEFLRVAPPYQTLEN